MMKIISVSGVTAGGKTTLVDKLAASIPKAAVLHFDDYHFEGEPDDFQKWYAGGGDYNAWKLDPLEKDIVKIISTKAFDYLLLDYPFAYCNRQLNQYIDIAFFINTPLDVALARRVLRDMGSATADEIRADLRGYLQYARVSYVHMLETVLSSADYVLDGMKTVEENVQEIISIIR